MLGGWTAEVARAYLDRTNFNGFKGDGAGAYSRLDRLIRIDTAGGRAMPSVEEEHVHSGKSHSSA
jgi:hypothetical protein